MKLTCKDKKKKCQPKTTTTEKANQTRKTMRRDRNSNGFDEQNEQQKKQEVESLKNALKIVESSEVRILAELKKLEAVEAKLLRDKNQLEKAIQENSCAKED
jgi:hypothetical protein